MLCHQFNLEIREYFGFDMLSDCMNNTFNVISEEAESSIDMLKHEPGMDFIHHCLIIHFILYVTSRLRF